MFFRFWVLYITFLSSIFYKWGQYSYHMELLQEWNEIAYGKHFTPCLSQFSSVAQLCPTLCDPTDGSTPGFPVHHQLPGLSQTHVHRVGDAIKPSHPLSSPSPLAFNLSQHQGLFQWVSSSHQVVKVLELQLPHQSFWWILRTHFF